MSQSNRLQVKLLCLTLPVSGQKFLPQRGPQIKGLTVVTPWIQRLFKISLKGNLNFETKFNYKDFNFKNFCQRFFCEKDCHYEQHRNNCSIPHKIWPLQEKVEIVLISSSFSKFWFLINIQIVVKDQNIGLILFRAL